MNLRSRGQNPLRIEFRDDSKMESNVFIPQFLVKTPETFTGNDHKIIKMWLRDFDRICEANGWDENKKKSVLPAFLSDRAGSFYDSLDASLSYNDMKDKIIHKFSPVGESGLSWATLNTRFQQPGESVEIFSEAISSLVQKSFPNATLAELSESKVKHFVYRSLPQIQQFLLQQNVEELNFDAAVLLAKRQENAMRQINLCPNTQGLAPPPPMTNKNDDKLADAIKQMTDKLSQPPNQPSTSASSSNRLEHTALKGRVDALERKFDNFSLQMNSIDQKLDRFLTGPSRNFGYQNAPRGNFQSRPRMHCNICNRNNHNTEQCFRNNPARTPIQRRRSATPQRQVSFQENR